MNKYSNEYKRKILLLYHSKSMPTKEIFEDFGIPKSTFYGWLSQNTSSNEKDNIDHQSVNKLVQKISKLENIIEILKTVNCTVHAPLKIKLEELELLYGHYSVHSLCDALDVSRGTFYNHMYRNKRSATWYSMRREELKIQIQNIYDESWQRFGSGKIAAVLHNRGYKVSLEMVRELMRDMGLFSVRQDSKNLYDRETQKYKNHINQHFETSAPNQVWVSIVLPLSRTRKFSSKYFLSQLVINLPGSPDSD